MAIVTLLLGLEEDGEAAADTGVDGGSVRVASPTRVDRAGSLSNR